MAKREESEDIPWAIVLPEMKFPEIGSIFAEQERAIDEMCASFDAAVEELFGGRINP